MLRQEGCRCRKEDDAAEHCDEGKWVGGIVVCNLYRLLVCKFSQYYNLLVLRKGGMDIVREALFNVDATWSLCTELASESVHSEYLRRGIEPDASQHLVLAH